MATNEPKLLAETTLTDGGPDTLFTVPSGHSYVVQQISITNTGGTDRDVDILLNAAQYLRKAINVPGTGTKRTVTFDGNITFEATDVLSMVSANGTDLDVIIAGIDRTL